MKIYAQQPSNVSALLITGNNVGIGTNNPTEKLEVAGNIKINGSLLGSAIIPSDGSVTTQKIATGVTLTSPTISTSLILNATGYTYGSGAAAAHRVSLSLNNVDNTSDANKPISNATQTALNGKSDTSHFHGNITNLGAIGVTANLPLITTTSGVITTGSFGTTANTFCQGNDSRLSDSREWSAITIDQIEAEAGISTTRRAWTSERIRQAIIAWYNTFSSAFRNFISFPTSDNFANLLTDENGTSGGFVRGVGATLTNPILAALLAVKGC